MRLILILAARNLFRHTRRTVLTASALVVSIALMVLSRAWTAAMERAVVEPAKIAENLRISEATVNAHLASIFRKLRVRGRGQLSAMLHRVSGGR